MITEVPVEQLRALFHAAQRFCQLAPWTFIGDDQVFGVVNPANGEKAYLTVMGSMGEYFALGVYPGAEGFRSLSRLFDEENEEDPEESIYQQHCLICAFENEEDLDPDDLALIKHVGVPFKGENAFPNFRSYLPGYMPWVPAAADVQLLQVALEQATWVAEQLLQNPALLSETGQGLEKVYFRVPFANGTQDWKSEILPADNRIDLSPPQLSIPLGEVASLKQLKRSDAIWLFEQLYLNMPSMDPGEERPFFPKAIVLLDIENQTMAGVEVVKPSEADDSILDTMITAFRDNGALPGQIVVASREHYILLKSFCKAINVDLYLDAEMQVISELREAIMEMMEGQSEQED